MIYAYFALINCKYYQLLLFNQSILYSRCLTQCQRLKTHSLFLQPIIQQQMKQSSGRVRLHFFLIVALICITSWVVWSVNVQGLQHSRNFYRALNYHILEHQTAGVYWSGPDLTNYPINEYYQLPDIQTFMQRMHNQMANLDQLAYGPIDQTAFNQSVQRLEVYYRKGGVGVFEWTLAEGLPAGQPFSFQNLAEIKAVLVQSQGFFFVFQGVDLGAGHIWDITFKIQPYMDTSIFVSIDSHQRISLASQHILPFIGGLVLGVLILWQFCFIPSNRKQNIIYCLASILMVGTAILAFSQRVRFQLIFMFDGVVCLATWLCAVRFYLKSDDYNLSFLLGQSYAMIGWLFASFGPLLIAFSLFGYLLFSRYSAQFSTLWKTFLSLFYICYYNMTYESAMVTSRANPISLIFFIVFVLLFTMCVYSGMLVSIFCSYVWRKREQQIRVDIENNLRIQCSNCDQKYRYADTIKLKPKQSFNLSEYLEIDFKEEAGREKYKRIMRARIERLRLTADRLIEEGTKMCREGLPIEAQRMWREDLWVKSRYISNLIGGG